MTRGLASVISWIYDSRSLPAEAGSHASHPEPEALLTVSVASAFRRKAA